MTKRDLVVRIASETGLIQADVAAIVQKTLDYISDELAAGNTIELRNFGVFETAQRPYRQKSPQAGSDCGDPRSQSGQIPCRQGTQSTGPQPEIILLIN